MNTITEKFEINSVPLYDVKRNNLTYLIDSLIKLNLPQQLITINLDFIRISSQNMEFLNLCKNSSINFIDGVPVGWLIKLIYKKNCEIVTGHLLFEACLEYCQANRLKIALVGSTENILSKVREKISNNYPLVEVFSIAPSPLFELNDKENKEVINQLNIFSPSFTFVALGCPRQEFWINNYKSIIGNGIFAGIGSVFTVFSGEAKKAPQFLSSVGMEWFWRFLHEPKRLFKRYFIQDIPFFILLLLKILTKRFI